MQLIAVLGGGTDLGSTQIGLELRWLMTKSWILWGTIIGSRLCKTKKGQKDHIQGFSSGGPSDV